MTNSENHPTQSINFSGGQLTGVQVGQAGRDLNQTQHNIQGSEEKQLTPAEVVDLIAQIEALFRSSDLPEEQKAKALKHLEMVKEETQTTEPDKDFAMKNLQRAMQVMQDADKTIGAGQGIWQKVQPVVTQLAPWFGLAAKAILPFV